MPTKKTTVSLATILKEFKLEGKASRRKLRKHFGDRHPKNDPWTFAEGRAYDECLKVLGVGGAKEKKITATVKREKKPKRISKAARKAAGLPMVVTPTPAQPGAVAAS